MEALYAAADISSFAAWVHETDGGMREQLTRRGYAVDTTTRAMGMSLDDVSLPRPEIELAPAAWREHLRLIGVSSALLRDLDPTALHLLVAQRGGESVATTSDSTMKETAASTTSGRSRIRVAVASAPR